MRNRKNLFEVDSLSRIDNISNEAIFETNRDTTQMWEKIEELVISSK